MVRFRPIPTYGHHMTWNDWIRTCDSGGLIDYDGHGDLATATQISNITIVPSQRRAKNFQRPEWTTHVVWYNK